MNWRSIRLELASTGQFPAGSVSRAYLIRLPLDDRDTVDEGAVLAHPSRATARRHWSSEPDEQGLIVKSGDEWKICGNGNQQRTLGLNGTPLRLGNKISLIEPDGTTLPLTVASIR